MEVVLQGLQKGLRQIQDVCVIDDHRGLLGTTPQHSVLNTWQGLAFEYVCVAHINQ